LSADWVDVATAMPFVLWKTLILALFGSILYQPRSGYLTT